MSFFKKIFSSIGIGSAKVDTILLCERLVPGDNIDVIVKIMGGNTQQQIEGLYFTINSTYLDTMNVTEYDDDEYESSDEEFTRTAIIEKYKVSDKFIIEPGETKEIPLTFQLPYYTPLTLGDTEVWIHTGLDIKKAKDPTDNDYIEVVPGEMVSALFDAISELGFELSEVECVTISDSFEKEIPFVQEFEFKPLSGHFRNKVDEIELVCFPSEDSVEVYMEIDRKARGISGHFAELMGRDETNINFTFVKDEISNLSNILFEILDNWVN